MQPSPFGRGFTLIEPHSTPLANSRELPDDISQSFLGIVTSRVIMIRVTDHIGELHAEIGLFSHQ